MIRSIYCYSKSKYILVRVSSFFVCHGFGECIVYNCFLANTKCPSLYLCSLLKHKKHVYIYIYTNTVQHEGYSTCLACSSLSRFHSSTEFVKDCTVWRRLNASCKTRYPLFNYSSRKQCSDPWALGSKPQVPICSNLKYGSRLPSESLTCGPGHQQCLLRLL